MLNLVTKTNPRVVKAQKVLILQRNLKLKHKQLQYKKIPHKH